MKKYILFTILSACVGLSIVLITKEAVSRESHRQEVVRASNCEKFGGVINKSAGKEVCPPTVNG